MNTVARRDRVVGIAAGIPLLLALIMPVLAIIDQTSRGTLSSYSIAMYSAYGVEVDTGLIYDLLYVVAGIALVFWLAAALVAWLSRRSSLVMLLIAIVVNAGLAVTLLFVTEYSEAIWPPVWGLLCALPALAGIGVAVLAWRRRELRHG